MRTMQIRDVSLFVKVVGHGEPLVLMHGGPGLDYTTLSSFESLADQFTLIFYDHRCNGRSSGDVESMTWENLTADADALRETLGFERWSVLGHSFGGNVALEYALRHPERLSSLILLDTSGDSWWHESHAPALLAKRGYGPRAVNAARRFFNGQLAPDEVARTVFKFIGAYFYHGRALLSPHALRAATRLEMRPEAQVFGFSRLLPGWTVMDGLREIEAPTLVMAGRHDFLFPPEHQAILADRIPNAHLEIIERAGHNPQDEQRAVVMEAVRRFLQTSARADEGAKTTAGYAAANT
jgi:proline iminopeptidase